MAARDTTTIEVDAVLLVRLREASLPESVSLTDAEFLERAARGQLGLDAHREV